MKRTIALLMVLAIILGGVGMATALAEASKTEEAALTVSVAAEGESEEGFVCLVSEDGTVYAIREYCRVY